MSVPLKMYKPGPGLPSILAPSFGSPLMFALTYRSQKSAEAQASAWNRMLSVAGLKVTVGTRTEDGGWPLVWAVAE